MKHGNPLLEALEQANAVILATGGMGLVRAAYSAGKPAYGVGPGNAPAYIEGSADVAKAVRDIIIGKTFDNGVMCSAENSVVVDERIAGEVRRAFLVQGGYFLSDAESDAVVRVLMTTQRRPNPKLVGQPATAIAAQAGVEVPSGTRVLIAELDGVGPDYPLSVEKLCPVLSFYTVEDWHAGCERCKEILGYGGMGHTMSIHSRNDAVILEFGLRKPAFRIVVNTPTTHGSVGLTTGLDPAMTLGCGGYGGNITSDNISPMHLLNIKRLAHEIRPAKDTADSATSVDHHLPDPSVRPEASRVDGATLANRVHAFLATRGVTTSPGQPPVDPPAVPSVPQPEPSAAPVAFVCEDDVRQAVRAGRSIVVDDHTIITPAARDLAARHRVLLHSGLSL